MYNSYFGLNESPFSIAPDPLYLYMSEHHREAMAHLQYGIMRDGGFVLLTGEVGAGKTTICRSLLEQLPEGVDIAFVFNPKVSVIELLETICDELRIDRPEHGSIKNLVDRINTSLLEANAQGRKTVLFIDEAQNLSTDVLEQLRLLTNLETNRYKLLQIVLLGQPELLAILDRQEMRQFSQRITARYHLGSLDTAEMGAYVRHRLEIAGCKRTLFPETLNKTLAQLTGGIPRLINLVCDRALLGAYTLNRQEVDSRILRQAAKEVLGKIPSQGKGKKAALAAGLAALVLFLWIAALWGWKKPSSGPGPGSAAPPQRQSRGENKPEAVLPLPEGKGVTLPLKWPNDFAVSQSMESAFVDLAGLWGLSYRADRPDYCAYAIEHGLDCLVGKDSLDTLRNMNQPAILTLYGDEGTPFYVVMAGLARDRAIFVAGGKQHELALSAIASRWFGEYLLLWQRPPIERVLLKPGGEGVSVEWLAKTLQELGIYEATGREVRLEGALLGAFKRFQLSSGLTPDGVLGPMTLIHLNTARNLPGPRLFPRGAN
ncbi:MAG: AAA family ATPase [Desulfurivibrionaceae bacterium]